MLGVGNCQAIVSIGVSLSCLLYKALKRALIIALFADTYNLCLKYYITYEHSIRMLTFASMQV